MTDQAGWRDYNQDYEPPRSMIGPLLFGVIVQAAALIAFRVATGGGFSGDWARFLGEVTGASLPVPLVLWFVFMRRREPRGWWKLPLIFWPLSFLLLFVSLGGGIDREEQFRLVQNSLAAAGEEALEKGADIGRLRRSGAVGEAGEVERVAFEFIEGMAADSRTYRDRLRAIGLVGMLDGPALRGTADLPAARAKVEAARALVARHRRLFAQRYADLNRQLEAAEISRQTRTALLGGFEEAQRRSRSSQDRLWELEAQAIEQIGRVLDILARGGWERTGPMYQFRDARTLVDFNAALAEVRRISAEQQTIQMGQRTRTRQGISDLRRSF